MAKLRVPHERRLGVDLAGAELDMIDQLIAFRKMRGLTQEEVAEKMGVERSVVSRFERPDGRSRKSHALSTVKRYAEAVNAYIAHFVVSAVGAENKGQSYQGLRDDVQEHLGQLQNHDAPEVSSDDVQKIAVESEAVNQIQATPRWSATAPAQPVHGLVVTWM